MPKLKELESQKKDNIVRAYIAKNMALYNLSDEEVAAKLHCVKRTFQNKKRNPKTFTLFELRALCTALKFTDDEKIMIM
ncbi:hypothetical protein lbkm_0644 [Lachnospiraceae bacterium KM106-2]|nr:hypothetical protein lbkm_0644 [Lachnospiraceae bacterium KM106-2]